MSLAWRKKEKGNSRCKGRAVAPPYIVRTKKVKRALVFSHGDVGPGRPALGCALLAGAWPAYV